MASSEATRSRVIGVVCALVGSIGFSGKPVLVKLAYQYDVDILTLLALRMLCSLPFFLFMAWWGGNASSPITRRDGLTILGLGFMGYYLASLLDFTGLQYISAGLGRLILYIYPTLVLIFSALFFRQPLRARHVASLVLSYCGIALVFHQETTVASDLQSVALGVILVFSSAVIYAWYLIGGSRVVPKIGSLRFTAYASLAASLFVVAHFLVTHEIDALMVSLPVFEISMLMAVFSTVLPLWLLAEALHRIGANQTALVSCIGPIATITIAHFFLGEAMTLTQIGGAMLVLVGIMTLKHGNPR